MITELFVVQDRKDQRRRQWLLDQDEDISAFCTLVLKSTWPAEPESCAYKVSYGPCQDGNEQKTVVTGNYPPAKTQWSSFPARQEYPSVIVGAPDYALAAIVLFTLLALATLATVLLFQ